MGRFPGGGPGAPPGRPIAVALRLTGAGLILAAAAVHLDLYLTGYRSIIADTAPGQARGDDINLNGGVWHAVTTAD
jgi:hypothetical protein